MQAKNLFESLRRFDAYPKTLEDFRVKTFGGATDGETEFSCWRDRNCQLLKNGNPNGRENEVGTITKFYRSKANIAGHIIRGSAQELNECQPYDVHYLTIISGFFMTILFLSELNYYLTKEVQPELFVDITRGQTKLKINLNVTFHKLPCAFLSIDAMDVSGENQIDVDHNLFKQRLNLEGEVIEDEPEKQELGDKSGEIVEAVKKDLDPKRCESCYGAETEDKKCCNTCEEVRDQYRRKGWAFKSGESIEQCVREGWTEKIKAQKNEGCFVYGYIEVNKVGGNFHIAPGKSFQQHHVHVHDIQSFGGEKFNMSHSIHHLSFGEWYPGIVNPLDGTIQRDDKTQMMFQYFVKIVPTTYTSVDGTTTYTNQFSVTKHSKIVGLLGESGLPGMFVTYELSPMMVKYTEKHRSFMHFLTGVCAIIGGIFTVAGLIDSMIYHSARALQKKIELGKAT